MRATLNADGVGDGDERGVVEIEVLSISTSDELQRAELEDALSLGGGAESPLERLGRAGVEEAKSTSDVVLMLVEITSSLTILVIGVTLGEVLRGTTLGTTPVLAIEAAPTFVETIVGLGETTHPLSERTELEETDVGFEGATTVLGETLTRLEATTGLGERASLPEGATTESEEAFETTAMSVDAPDTTSVFGWILGTVPVRGLFATGLGLTETLGAMLETSGAVLETLGTMLETLGTVLETLGTALETLGAMVTLEVRSEPPETSG